MSKPAQFNRCGATCTALQDSIRDAVSAMKKAGQDRTDDQAGGEPGSSSAEYNKLKAENEKLKADLSRATAPNAQPGEFAVSNGGGAGSVEMRKEMAVTNWHGKLGRTHMADVDAMTDDKRKELDTYLHSTLKKLFPPGQGYTNAVDSKAMFSALAAMGLRMEQRSNFVGTSSDNTSANELIRVRAYISYSYMGTSGWDWYWTGLALETLLELARYRGLFHSDGSLKETV